MLNMISTGREIKITGYLENLGNIIIGGFGEV